jgi:hypothetical protein
MTPMILVIMSPRTAPIIQILIVMIGILKQKREQERENRDNMRLKLYLSKSNDRKALTGD